MSNKLRLLKGVLYRLKRSYGCELAVYEVQGQDVDMKTGRASQQVKCINVKRAIVLPSKIDRGLTKSATFVQANGNFQFGGTFTDLNKQIIIDMADLPPDYYIGPEDRFYIMYNERRWNIKVADRLDFNLGYILDMERVEGATGIQIRDRQVRDRLVFKQGGYYDGPLSDNPYVPADKLTFTQTVIAQPVTVHKRLLEQTLTFLERAED